MNCLSKRSFLLSFCVLLFLTIPLSSRAGQSGRPGIDASDVVFMYSASDASQYDQYEGTVVGWGGRPRGRSEAQVAGFRRRVEEAHKRGMRYCGSVDFLVDFRGFIDFRPDTFMDAVCRDLDGEPIRVPWLMDHEYKGHPAWWWCTNNPDYRAYLRDQTERACSAPIDGLHIDDYSGTSHCSSYRGGCFCPHCMKGFRGYLKETFSDKELGERGIKDINSFDYGDYLRSRGVEADTIRRRRGEVPLIDGFQEFQNREMKERVGETFEYAENLRGRPLVRSVNSGVGSARQVLPAPLIDYFCGEVGQNADGKRPSVAPVFVYRLVEALDRRQTATASGHDWAWIKANEKPGLVRTWIAQTYASGSCFMAPHRQWCYTPELGTHWWSGKPEDFAWLYRFVREKASLLDGYRTLSRLALVYRNEDFGRLRGIATELAASNVPYVFLVGEQNLPRSEALHERPYACLFSASAGALPQEKGMNILQWEGLDNLQVGLKNDLVVRRAQNVYATIRFKPEEPGAPIVVHLLNQNYALEEDDVRPVDVEVAISDRLVAKAAPGRSIESIVAHAPRSKSRTVELNKTADGIGFAIDALGLWAIVELKVAAE